MNCASCGKELKVGANFCAHCGAEVKIQAVEDVSLTGDNSRTTKSDTSSEAVISGKAATGEPVVLYKRNTQKTIAIACSVLIGLVVVILAVLLAWKALYPRELMLDANTIKDEALRNTLTVSYDKDGDGKLSEKELDEVQTLELDSGDDYNYLYLFRNLSSLTVNNSEVTSLDLSENINLESGDFRNASSVEKIKVPPRKDYCDYHLPDNDGLNVVFPKGSDFEVKYVPKKVEETYFFFSRESKATYEQDVESAFKVNELKTMHDSSSSTESFVYGSDGRIKQTNSPGGSWPSTRDLSYDDSNRLVNENLNHPSGSPYDGDYPIEYNNEGNVAKVKDDIVCYDGNRIEVKWINDSVSYRWELDSSETVSYIEHVGTNSYYMSHDYAFYENSSCTSESIESYCVKSSNNGLTTPDGERFTAQEEPNCMSATVSYSYENNRLVKATFDNGFEQNYDYDSRGNLVSITSTGSPVLNFADITTSCSVEYAMVIAKKSQTPLSFIVLPGVSKRGIVNFSTNTRQIAVSNVWATANFTGKFWWDEENIINNQVEAAKLKSESLKKASAPIGDIEVEAHTVQVSVPCDPYYGTGPEREDKTWNYDLLTNPNNSASINKINSVIKDSMDKSVQKAEAVPYGKNAGQAILDRNVKVSYLNDKIVCFMDSNFTAGWGPHGFRDAGAVIFDLSTGERINVASYLGVTESELFADVKQAAAINLSNRASDLYSTDKVINALKIEKDDSLGISLEGLTKLVFNNAGVLYYASELYEFDTYSGGTRNIVVKSDSSSDVGKNLSDIES